MDGSYAVVNPILGAFNPTVLANDATKLSVMLVNLRLDVLFQPFTVQVFWRGNLISTDTADQGLVYLPGVPGAKATANFKAYPANAKYFGFGEKGGRTLAMNQTSLTFFNYDNYQYQGSSVGNAAPLNPNSSSPNNAPPVVPAYDGSVNSAQGPLNESEPLYNSIPFLIEDNPNPLDSSGRPTGVPYSYGLFLDNEGQTYFNLGKSSAAAGNMYGKYYFGALYGEIDYYFMAGDTTPDVLEQYTNLTGRPSLAPMWALGYHQGCYGYFKQDLVVGAAQAYRNAQVPLDGIHIDVDFQNNYRTFTASPKKFPGGGAPTFSALKTLGVKASTNITGIVTMIPQDEDGNTTPYATLDSGNAIGAFYKDIRVDAQPPAVPGNFITNEDYGVNTGINTFVPNGASLGTYGYYADLGRANVRAWWGQQYKPLLDAGLEMVWQDMTDPATVQSASDPMPWKTLALNLQVTDMPTGTSCAHAEVHNVFALNLLDATYNGLVALRTASGVDKRPFIIARGSYAGVQRYAATWTGDSASTWQFLSILIPEILNFGLSGQPLAGADVGGFASTAGQGQLEAGVADPELLIRWTTLSAFIGWFRNHYDGYNKLFQEPYAYAQWTGNPTAQQVLPICRNYIEIRYKLLQYFYDALYEATTSGIPIARAMFLTDRTDPMVYQHLDDQFMVGANILVAPVVVQGVQYRDVYLPAGSDWFAYADNKVPLVGPSHGGGDPISWYAPVNIVPMYVRAGAIVPRRELEQYVGQLAVNPLTFDVYPGAASTHKLYLDDKVSTQAKSNNAYRLTELSQSQVLGANRIQTLNVVRTFDGFTPAEPYYFVAMLKSLAPLSVSVNGVALTILNAGSDIASADALAASAVNAAYYSQSLNTTFIKVFDPQVLQTGLNTTIVGTFPLP